MIEINDQSRRSGKTTKVIELMKNDDFALCLVPNNNIKKILFPKEVQDRVVSGDIQDLISKLRSRKCNKIIIDELMYSKFDIARLFYELGKYNIVTIVYGTGEVLE